MKKVWRKVQKISGKYSPQPTPAVKNENGIIETNTEIVNNIIVSAFASVLEDNAYPREFIRHKTRVEKQQIDFSTNEDHPYNEDITIQEYHHALSQTTETSPGADKITYAMLKNAHSTLTLGIVRTINRIYNEGTFPTAWRPALGTNLICC